MFKTTILRFAIVIGVLSLLSATASADTKVKSRQTSGGCVSNSRLRRDSFPSSGVVGHLAGHPPGTLHQRPFNQPGDAVGKWCNVTGLD